MVNEKSFVNKLTNDIFTGKQITYQDAVEISKIEGQELFALFENANKIARFYTGYNIEICSILNAKSGGCTEDCKFCSQSKHYSTNIKEYSMLATKEIVSSAKEAAVSHSNRFGIVCSGNSIGSTKEVHTLLESIDAIHKNIGISPCASLGNLDINTMQKLYNAGLKGYHHNLETSESYFPTVCSTHDYKDDVKTVENAKKIGFMTCSGGIFGIGESWDDRIKLAIKLRDLNVDSIPINYLIPIKGTPLENKPPLSGMEALKIISLYRFILPRNTIKVCAGRNECLGKLSSWIFYAGANGIMTGNYLTKTGPSPEDDIKLIKELGFTPVAENLEF